MAVEAGAAFFSAAFLAAAPATPLRMLPMTPPALFTGEDFFSVPFLATVDVLPSLDSLMPLNLR